MGAEKLALAKKNDATLTSSYNKKRLQYDSRPSLKIEWTCGVYPATPPLPDNKSVRNERFRVY